MRNEENPLATKEREVAVVMVRATSWFTQLFSWLNIPEMFAL